MSSGDALTPGKTGGVGSAIFHLHDNGTLDYQVRIKGACVWLVAVVVVVVKQSKNKIK